MHGEAGSIRSCDAVLIPTAGNFEYEFKCVLYYGLRSEINGSVSSEEILKQEIIYRSGILHSSDNEERKFTLIRQLRVDFRKAFVSVTTEVG